MEWDINLEVIKSVKKSLKTQLSLTIGIIVLFTVALISILSNILINQKFEDYITKQQQLKTEEIVTSVNQQYDTFTRTWNMDSIHTIGMYVLYDGYIIKVYDSTGEIVWDAESHDMKLCNQVMMEISERMQKKYPRGTGEFVAKNFDLDGSGTSIGKVSISYYGPYFLSENDFRFLDALNTVLVGTGIISLVASFIISGILAKRIISPISDTVEVAKEISNGNYNVRFGKQTNMKELDDLIVSVNHLANSLGEQENLRKQLTADVSHELRTPLATIGTHLEAMIEGIWEPTKERLQSCYEEILRISKLVQDLERLAKVESGNLRLNKVSVDLLILAKNVSSNFEMELTKKNINLSIDGDSSVLFLDKDRVSQVIFNLLSNAIKYAKENGHIKIHISDTEDSSIFSIEDDGIGISQSELPFIFERFYRADKSRNRNTGGTGIGLAIVKAIVTAHDGDVEVYSQLGIGSTFQVTFPKSV